MSWLAGRIQPDSGKGGDDMLGPAERRDAILAVLNERRYDKIDNLAHEFGVDGRTIRRDIEALSISSPIYTKTGRYDGGVYVLDGAVAGRKYLSTEQTELLTRLAKLLTGKDLSIIQSIIKAFALPNIFGGASNVFQILLS